MSLTATDFSKAFKSRRRTNASTPFSACNRKKAALTSDAAKPAPAGAMRRIRNTLFQRTDSGFFADGAGRRVDATAQRSKQYCRHRFFRRLEILSRACAITRSGLFDYFAQDLWVPPRSVMRSK
jgi:hypothetical protein